MVTLFLKENDIPSLTSLSGNIDADALKPHIFTAQTIDVKRILTVGLYDKMLKDYEEDNLTGNYLIIYNEYLVPLEAYLSCMYYMTFGGVKITNNGTVRVSFEGGSALSESEVNRLIGVYRNLAKNIESFFIEYVSANNITEYSVTDAAISGDQPLIQWF